jgi:hypothetical protein
MTTCFMGATHTAAGHRFPEVIEFAELPADHQCKAVLLVGDLDLTAHAAGQCHTGEVLQLFDLPRKPRLLRLLASGGLGQIARLHHPQKGAQAIQREVYLNAALMRFNGKLKEIAANPPKTDPTILLVITYTTSIRPAGNQRFSSEPF